MTLFCYPHEGVVKAMLSLGGAALLHSAPEHWMARREGIIPVHLRRDAALSKERRMVIPSINSPISIYYDISLHP